MIDKKKIIEEFKKAFEEHNPERAMEILRELKKKAP